MKRITLLFTLFTLVAGTAMAEDYNFLVIEQSGGAAASINLTELRKITFEGENLVVTTLDDKTSEYALESLARMYFSDSMVDAISSAKAESATGIEGIYTLDGRRLTGTSPDLLQGGVYIIKKTNGTTIKIGK